MKPKRAERKRSTNLELLGGVNADALRALREIASQADLPLERVFRDVVAIGVSVVSDPDESPYQSLIAFRNGLANKQMELANARAKAELEVEVGRGTADGSLQSEGASLPGLDSDVFIPATEETVEDRLDLAVERPGQRPAVQEDSGLLASEG